MKKIINNKVYDTTTAKWCGEFWNGYDSIDFEYVTEDLYLKKTGEFFLHCQSEGRQMITPLTYEEAREWAGDFLTAEEYEDIFGEVSEDYDGEVGMHVTIPKTLYDKIGQERLQNGRKMKDVVVEALDKYFDN